VVVSLDDPTLDALVTLGAAAHPGIREPAGLRDMLAQRGKELTASELKARAADLYFAFACVARDEAAIALLSALIGESVPPVLGKLGIPHSDYEEIVQRTRVALLAPDDRSAGIAGYSGRGELRAYVRSTAVRIGLKRIERETAPGRDDASQIMALMPDPDDSAELKLLKQQYREELRKAFSAAFAALSPHERTLLRQHYLDGLTVDLLAPVHQVHRSTCARWIEAARVKVLRDIRQQLRRVLGVDDRELDRAVALVQSQLDLSLRRNLAGSTR
jgi:RNA polymerase sigma-70 factor (ECF subfamily)